MGAGQLFGVGLLAGAALLFLRGQASAAMPGAAGPGRMNPADVLAIVQQLNATEFGGWFDGALADVMAVVQIESNFDARAFRAEPQLSDASRGLMQILYATAQDRGYAGDPDGLFDPTVNLRYGMAQLVWIWDYLDARGEANEDNWIAAYNAGVGNVLRGYRNLSYVNRWRLARERWASSVS